MSRYPSLPDGSHLRAGSFDRAGRWYPHSDYSVPGAFGVRAPTRAWKYSYLKHYYSGKYAGLLATHAPDLYAALVVPFVTAKLHGG